MYLPLKYQRALDRKYLFGWLKEVYPIPKVEETIEEPIKIKWIQLTLSECMALATVFLQEPEVKVREEIREETNERIIQLASIVKEIMNKNLIPKYRKIVGETVPTLD